MKALALLVLLISPCLAQIQAKLSSRAQSLSLNQTWLAPMPSTSTQNTNYTTVPATSSYISKQWLNPINYFYGPADVSFQPDPYGSNSTVLKVLYSKGSFTPSGTKAETGTVGGAEFLSIPYGNQSFNSALLRYDIAFDRTFNWNLGGKLPGIFGGSPALGCTGGDKATGTNCFSSRIMWRAAGTGEAYAYIPPSTTLCQQPLVMCNDDFGTSFARGMLNFKTEKWTTLEMFIQVNDPSKNNGILRVWQDNNLVINQEELVFRTSYAIAVSSFLFSTFFGGGSSQYATPVDTYTYFRNIEFSVGSTAQLSLSSAAPHVANLPLTWLLVGAALFMSLWR